MNTLFNKNFLIYGLKKFLKLSTTKIIGIVESLNYNPDLIDEYVERNFCIQYKDFINDCKKNDEIYKDNSVHFISIIDKEKFPEYLYKTSDPCIFLFYVGDINLLLKRGIAIIGTRKPTGLSKNNAFYLGQYFGKTAVIISGLALGCDTEAHKGCLNVGGKTIAVLGTSIEYLFKKKNNLLVNEIVNKGGLLISEYSNSEITRPYFFACRDRIQSYLSKVVLVVEATEDSGTMICVNRSLHDKKLVFALNNNKINSIANYVNPKNENDLKKINELIMSDDKKEPEQLSIFGL